MIRDALFAVLADPDIQQDVLSHNNQNLSLEVALTFISTKEAGKQSQSSPLNPAASGWVGKPKGFPGKCSVHPKMNHTDAECYQQHSNLAPQGFP
jgi:hypothetical protein